MASITANKAQSSGGGGGRSKPVLIDLSGKGISIDTLPVSQNFFDFDGDGYQTRTAWAGKDTGVLVFDADGDGKISRSSEFAFTEWAEGADSDLEALRRVFDTNNNNKLDAGDSRWADFKIWLNGSLVSLASQNIASIDLTATGSGQNFEDGSAITGTSTFTRTDGTTGTVGDAVLASETDSQIVKQSMVTNADGSTVTTITGFEKDGSISFRNVVTASADGLTKRTQFDDDGDGVFDRSQTDVRSVTSGVQKRVVSNFNADGSLKDSTTTTTSADLKTVTTDVDQDGDGKRDQSQVYVKNADGSTSTTVTQFSTSGKVLKRVLTTGSADGLTKTVKTDADGDGVYETVQTEKIDNYADGRRRTMEENKGSSGNLTSRFYGITSADGLFETAYDDREGDGTYETRTTTKIETDAAGTTKRTQDYLNSSGTLLTRTITTTSKDGAAKTVQRDLDGDGTIDRTIADTMVNASGALTQTVTEKSGTGTLLGSTTTKTSADRKTIMIDADVDGDGKLDATRAILLDASGVSTSTTTELAANGVLVTKTVTVTSADGLTITTRTDANGDGTFDETVSDVTTGPAGGARTRTVTSTGADGSLTGKVSVATSADGLTETTSEDLNADGQFDLVTVDATKLNADNSRLNTVTKTSSDGTLQSKIETLISIDRKTVTTRSDLDGDGKLDATKTVVTAADGSRLETVSRTAAGGQLIEKTETSVSGNGFSTIVKRDADGDGVFDTTTTTSIAFNTLGDRTTTVTATPTAKTTELLSKQVTKGSANGLRTDVSTDADGDGTFETMAVELTSVNTDGSTTVTKSLTDSTGKLLQGTVTNTSGSKLAVTTQEDADGNGTFERVTKSVIALAADGSQTETVEVKGGDGTLVAKEVTVTKANRHDLTVTTDLNGDGVTDETHGVIVNADGSTTSVDQTFDATSKLTSKSTETRSANDLSRTLTVDANGDGVTDRSTSDVTTLNANGSKTQVFSEFGTGGALVSRTTIETSANGLTKRTTWAGADGATKRSSTETTVLNADGGSVVTVSFFKAGGSLESQSVKTVAAHGTTTTLTQDVDGDGVVDKKTVSTKLADGSITTTSTDYSAANVVKGVKTVTTSANGLTQTTDFDSDGNGPVDKRLSSQTVLNTDGSRTTTVSTFVSGSSGMVLKDKTVTDVVADGFGKTTKWDLNADGTFDKSQTALTVLNADGSRVETLSNFTGATLSSRTRTTTSGNGLSVTTQLDPTSTGSYAQTTTDVTALNANGSSMQTVTSSKSDGSVLSKRVSTTSADDRTVTTVLEEVGQSSRTTTATTDTLADGAVRVTNSTQLTGSTTLVEKAVTLTSADKRTVTIERDMNGDGVTDQREERIKALSGEETTIITNLGSGGSLKDRMTTVRSADGRRTTTSFDRDGNGAIDRTKVVEDVVNADGSGLRTTTDTDISSGKPASKTVTKVSADGLTTATTRDIDGDGTVDQTEDVSVDPTGATTTVLANKTAAARSVATLGAGNVQWKNLVAETVTTVTSADGRSTVSTFAYAEEKAGTVTRTTVTMRQTLQIDGSVMTDVTETNASGTVIAKGQIATTVDGRTTVLTKDNDANGTVDHRETAVTRLDGSIVLTKVDLNSDGSTAKTVVDTVNMLGTLVSRSGDESGPKTEDVVIASDGSSTRTRYDPASGAVLSVTKATKDGIPTSNILYDPLGKEEWTRVEQQFDASGNKTVETQYIDDGTRTVITFDAANTQSWSRREDAYDRSNRLVSQTTVFDDGSKRSAIWDVDGSKSWSTQVASIDAANRTTFVTITNDDGTRSDITYDVAGNQPWRQSEQSFDTSGRLVAQVNSNRDGTRLNIYWDAAGTQPWRAINEYRDAAGRNTQTFQYNDDGTQTQLLYDPTNSQTWSLLRKDLNASSQLTYQNRKNDNGTRDDWTYDAANANNWSSIQRSFDASDRLASQADMFDDGTSRTHFYDIDNVQPWKDLHRDYDASNRLLSQLENNDDGSQGRHFFDATNAQPWAEIHRSYDASTRLVSELVNNDNGTSSRYFYDPANSKAWTDIQQDYNASVQLTAQATKNDNGTKYLDLYDLSNAQTYKELHQRISVNGNIYYEDSTKDDGSIVKYRLMRHEVKGGQDYYTAVIQSKRSASDTSPITTFDNKRIVDTSLYGIVPNYVTWPVALDLNQDGNVQIQEVPELNSEQGGSALFDWNGDGTRDRTAWVGPADGLLAIDLGANGEAGPDDHIDQARELSFRAWVDGSEDDAHLTDLEALRRVFDTNHDNVLSALDDRWGEFRVWQDLNRNGVSDAGELKTMSEAGITLINLVPSTDGSQMFSDGSMITGTSAYQTTDGRQHVAADVALAWRPTNTTPA